MSCNFCRDSIEGLKEIEIQPKQTQPLEFSPIPQGQGGSIPPVLVIPPTGLTMSPNFMIDDGMRSAAAGKLYQCQWCTEYWHKKLSVRVTHGEPGTGEFGTGLQLDFVEKVEPMGYDLDKIRGDLT